MPKTPGSLESLISISVHAHVLISYSSLYQGSLNLDYLAWVWFDSFMLMLRVLKPDIRGGEGRFLGYTKKNGNEDCTPTMQMHTQTESGAILVKLIY